jgi:hypothetical protein
MEKRFLRSFASFIHEDKAVKQEENAMNILGHSPIEDSTQLSS